MNHKTFIKFFQVDSVPDTFLIGDRFIMRRVVVTGGSGFVGKHLVHALLAKDQQPTRVVVFDLRPYHHDDPKTANFVQSTTGSVTRLGDLIRVFRDSDIVFHFVCANPLDDRNEALMWRVNVDGTKNVIEACKQCRVPKLIYLSSASVVFDGTHMRNVDESQPYPARYLDYYSQTKAEAERLVLNANSDTMLTCALRPSSVFGEGDPLYVPRLIDAGRQSKSRYIIGNGKTKWEFTYVGNVASACINAADKLTVGSPVAGQAYFITNDETTILWEHMALMLGSLGYDTPRIRIPFLLCYILASIIDFVLLVISPIYKPSRPPTFNKHRVMLLTTDRSISCEKAKLQLGYTVPVSMAEANRRTIEYFKPQAACPVTKKE